MGGVAKAVSNAVSSVGDAFEGVGKVVEEVAKGAVEVVDQAGTWIDNSIIQPIKDNPIESAVMIAAVVYGGPLAASYLGTTATVGTAVAAGTASAGIAASKGASVEDTLRAAAIGAGAGAVTVGVGTAVSPTIGTTAGRIVGATTGGATAATAAGRDPLQGALVGGVTSGIGEAVNLGVNYAADTIRGIELPTSTPTPTYEFGIDSSKPSMGFGVNPSVPTGSTATDFGIRTPTSFAATPLYGDYGNIQTSPGTQGISKEFGIDPSKEGGIGIKYDPESTSVYGEINPALPEGGLPSTYTLGSETSSAKEQLKKVATRAISQNLLSELFGGAGTAINTRSRFGGGVGEEDTLLPDSGTGTGDLVPITQAKYELKKFASGSESRLIPFKDDEPQAPIPPGFTEVETVGAAKGGLMSTTMVKYSKKALMGPRKTVTKPKEKETTRKGLGVKKK